MPLSSQVGDAVRCLVVFSLVHASLCPKDTVRMGSTLEEHRAVIGRFAARQISHNWKPSSSSSAAGISRSFKSTEKKRKKPHVAKADRTCVGRGIHLILMFSLLATTCPVSQHIAGYVPSDPGSYDMTGYGNSEGPNMANFNSLSHQLAKLVELPTLSSQLTQAAVETIAIDPEYQVSLIC